MNTTKIAGELTPLKADKHIAGKPVFTFAEGKKAGIVKDVLFDANFESLEGISLGKEGIFSRSSQFVPVSQIKMIGEDIILIESVSSIETKDKQELETFIALTQLYKKEVVDRGIKLAIFGDVIISPDAKILGITFSKALAEGKINSVDILSCDAIKEIGGKDDPQIHIDLDKF